MEELKIGELARRAQVSVDTIRYYERRGLLPAPARRPSGYRRYEPDMARRLRFIKRAQALGFSLEDIAELLALRVDPEATCAEIKRRAQMRLADIAGKMAALQKMGEVLERLAASCEARAPTSECPILEALDD